MTLTVRLDESIAAALNAHCASTGATKSRVVQQSLVVYLMREAANASAVPDKRKAPPASASFAAFDRAGLIGGGSLGADSADKAAVRRKITGSA
ncbi:hypothetical protein BH11PSE9_BH11PSE9_03310 [soil metagenome]